MKKIICLMLSFFMFSAICVSAADEYDFLSRTYTSYEQTTALSLELKQQLGFFKLFNDNTVLGMFDAQTFFESLADMNMTSEAKVNISSDYKKIQMSIEGKSSIPMQINNNFRLTADTKTGMWIDLDFSDDANPKYTYIMQNPMLNKYMTADVISLMRDTDPNNAEKSISMMKAFLNKDTIKTISETTKKSIVKNSTVKKSGSKYTFTFDDTGIKQLLFDIFDKINPIVTASMDKDEKKEYENSYSEITKAVKDLQIIGKNGVSSTYTLDRSGNIASTETSIEADTNIHDFIKALFGFSADIKKEDCNINFSIDIKSELKNINKTVKITAPQITPENSVNINEMGNGTSQPDDDFYVDNYFVIETDTYKSYDNGELAFPIRDVAKAFGIPDENISCSDGVITIIGTDLFKTAQITENSTVMTVDGTTFTLHTPVTEINGKALVDTSFIKYLFDADYGYGYCDFTTGIITASFERAVYDDEYFEEYDEYDFDSCNYFYVYSDSFIKSENGNVLIPAEDILGGFNIFDFTYENGILNASAKKPFKHLTVSANSDIFTADGKEYKMNTPGIEKDGRLYVDISFAEKCFGVKCTSGSYDIQYGDVNCDFEKTEINKLPIFAGL